MPRDSVTVVFRPPLSTRVKDLLAKTMLQYLADHRTLGIAPDDEDEEDLGRLMRQPPRRCL